jgi:hypothetical protein
METEISLLCSQEPTTDPCPDMDESIPYPTFYFFNIDFNIIPRIRVCFSVCLVRFFY